MPKVSIIMNCHNGEKYLREAIDSIYSQTFQDWEIVFFDNASTDNSAEIANSYDDRVRYIKNNELITLGEARKEAVLQATGDWVAFLDTDDRWYPEKLKKQLDALSDTDYLACYAGIREITPDGKKIRNARPIHKTGNVIEKLLYQFEVNMVTPMFRRDIVSEYNINFNPVITASEEYNFFVRLAARGPFLIQSDILGEYRVSSDSLTNRQISQWPVERLVTLDQLKCENPGIENDYTTTFREAYARGIYYEARYFMSVGRIVEARNAMATIADVDFRYRLLLILIYIPKLWNLAHETSIKRRLSKYLWRC